LIPADAGTHIRAVELPNGLPDSKLVGPQKNIFLNGSAYLQTHHSASKTTRFGQTLRLLGPSKALVARLAMKVACKDWLV